MVTVPAVMGAVTVMTIVPDVLAGRLEIFQMLLPTLGGGLAD